MATKNITRVLVHLDKIKLQMEYIRAITVAEVDKVATFPASSLDERELLQGYREASPEIREIMLDAAHRAIKNKNKLKPHLRLISSNTPSGAQK
ncbi:MAG: hypothetical protein ACYC3O_07270 [Burkholderiales bacterium]